jgi:DNA adenine methylase
MRFPSPLRYPGGKSRIFPFVTKLFYENDLIGTSYAEPYAGGCGLALKLLFGEFVDKIYINDLDRAIYAFWKTVLDYPEDLCKWIIDVKVDIATWRKYKHVYVNNATFSDLELAKATFFLNRTNVSGVMTGGMIGGLAQESKYGIDARFYRSESVNKIQRIAALKERIQVSDMDGITFVRRLDRRKESIFIYLDPPYVHKASELYMNHYSRKDHKRLSRFVKQMKKQWMLSYDQNDFVLQLYDERKKLFHSLNRGTSKNVVGNEIIVFSDNLSFENSASYLRLPISVAE